MSVGRRVAKLRLSHGESLREAAMRTGVSHTTIARIEKGEVTGSFHSTLRKIADGYNVRVEYLLTGRDPRQDFEISIRRMSLEERSKLFFVSAEARTRMVLEFLHAEYPGEFTEEQLAQAVGADPRSFPDVLRQWQSGTVDAATSERLAVALSELTGISLQWFQAGTIASELFESLPADVVGAYIQILNKAVRAHISPGRLEMAVDLLIHKERDAAAARMPG